MNFQAIVLAGFMALGTSAFSQEKYEGIPPRVENVEPRGKGLHFRGEEFQRCEVCKAQRKHMKAAYPNAHMRWSKHRHQGPPKNR